MLNCQNGHPLSCEETRIYRQDEDGSLYQDDQAAQTTYSCQHGCPLIPDVEAKAEEVFDYEALKEAPFAD